MAKKKLSQFKQILLVRFMANIFLLTGLFIGLGIAFQFGPVMASELNYRKDQLFGVQRQVQTSIAGLLPGPSASGIPIVSPSPSASVTDFAALFQSGVEQMKPVSTEYGIVIPKIDANSVVIPNIDLRNEAAYDKALSEGVAEAAGSTAPGVPGNLYIFSHSTNASWNVARYNAVFYLLRELVTGDKVSIFYKQRLYTYEVFDKTVVDPNDLSLLNNRYDKPVLTLQTCDPPGFLYRRLIVRAKLVGS